METTQRFLPLFVDLKDRPVLVVGAGKVALRKCRELLEYGAKLVVVAPDFVPGFEELALETRRRPWQAEDLDGICLVFAATSDPAVNREIHTACQARNLLCNVVDVTELCDFHSAACARDGNVSVAVHSGGGAPGLAAWLRRRLQEWMTGLGELASAVTTAREESRRTMEPARREEFWKSQDYQELWSLCRREGSTAVLARLAADAEAPSQHIRQGRVILVGAGPGHPDLITRMGLLAIEQATALVPDRLVARELLDLAPRSCQVFPVGKKGFDLSTHQRTINELIVRLAQEGHTVVRLKGGDPFVFGRGGEEIEACQEAGIPVEVVPGLSSALTVPTYAGIPVTHRGLSRSFAIVTGHTAKGVITSIPEAETLVFLMPHHSLEELRKRMYEKGWRHDTPASAVQSGTLPGQRILHSTLEAIVEDIDKAGLESPMIVVVGPVAGWAARHAAVRNGFTAPRGCFPD